MADQNPTKRCSLCHWYLPLDCFHKSGNGLRPECKDCRKIDTQRDYQNRKADILEYNRRYAANNADKLSISRKEWREKNRESVKVKKAAYFKANAAKYLQHNRLRRQQKRDTCNEYSRKWRRTNPEKRRASLKQNKAKRRQVAGVCSPAQWIAKCEYFGWCCYLCRVALTPKTTHMDHRKPLSKGGTHWPANLAPACRKCNLSKNNKTEVEFRKLLNAFPYIA